MGTKELGEELRRAIRDGRCTAADLAARAGTTPKTVRTWTSGRAQPRLGHRRAIEACTGWEYGRVDQLLEQSSAAGTHDYGVLELFVVTLERLRDTLDRITDTLNR